MTDELPEHAQLKAMPAVARAHGEHERHHSLLKLEHAVSLQRDANTLKVHLSDGTTAATTGVPFMADGIEPAELTAMKRRFEATAEAYERLSGRLAGPMAAEWKRLDALLTPAPAAAARARFAALARTATAGNAYGVGAHLLAAALDAMRNLDLTPSGIRADPAGSAALLRTTSCLVDTAAATTAEQAASLGRSAPDRTAFSRVIDALVAPT
ncbi:hypothetical protein OG698_03260 [Streptomyces sp. NBC_01003]|uniref:hypothetical protein n=1 Tax=Streptomyces sp. NBC_01003 TaxID=2903714 RepID=UPI00386AC6B3|nr:hypothetical protein OG698_03260 [Streptomyces sp. NBC_01003]